MRHIKEFGQLFEDHKASDKASSAPLYELRIRVTSVEPDGNWDNPGHWGMYKNEITVILPYKDGKIALEKIASGEYITDIDAYCYELDDVFSESNVKLISSRSLTLDEFTENLQDEVYDATLDYYRRNFGVDGEDGGAEIWGGDGINDAALQEITESGGHDWSFREMGSNEIKEMWDKITDEERGFFAKYNSDLTPEERREYEAIGRHKKRLI